MKNCVYTLLCIAVILPVLLYGQTIVPVASDGASGGNLDNAINAAIASKTLSTTVFQLEAAGLYLLQGPVTIPAGTKLTITAPDPGTTPATALPMIMGLAGGGVTWRYNFDVFGDISLKNIWLMYASTTPAQLGTMSLEMDNDSTRNKNIANFENVIFEYSSNGCVESRANHLIATFKNCYFRNDIDQHLRYYGRALTWPYASTTYHTDSVSFVNCTFANMGYGFMQEAPQYSDHVWFNHCTFLNMMMFPIESSYWYWLNVNNCLFVNTQMFGDIIANRSTLSPTQPPSGTISIDTLGAAVMAFPYTESQRHIVFTHSAYFLENWLTDYMANNPFSLDPNTGVNLKPNPMPMISTNTRRIFNTKTTWPYVSMISSTLIDSVDPGFVFPPTNYDNIKTFLLGRWSTGTNIDWAYDPSSDLSAVWPMNEDLSYSNSRLKTGGMGGFPIGDLYHWWPTQYTAWKAQEQTENNTIYGWLTNSITTGVKEQSSIPAKYELNQNYPNPFNPTTQIEYSVPERGNISLKVYNLLGEEVATLFTGVQQAGNHVATFNGTGLTSGVYFYRLQAGNFSDTKKLVLMK